MRVTRCVPIILALVVLLATVQASPARGATRHPMYIGNITAISATALAIHSKTHNTDHKFVVNSQTKFLKQGKPISRFLFKPGAYVTVSYSAGPHGTLVAWHVSLRK